MAETGEIDCAVMFTPTSLPVLTDAALLLDVRLSSLKRLTTGCEEEEFTDEEEGISCDHPPPVFQAPSSLEDWRIVTGDAFFLICELFLFCSHA